MATKIYTPDVLDRIREYAPTHTAAEMAEIISQITGRDITVKAARSVLKKNKIKYKHVDYVPYNRLFTDEQEDYIRAHAYGRTFDETAALFNAEYGTEFTVAQIRTWCKSHHVCNGRDARFIKGQESFNKGKKQSEYMTPEAIERTKATRFQKGSVPHNHLPVGAEVVTTDGYVKVKIAEPNVWQFKARLVWEETNGPIPEGMMLRYIDCNPLNCDIDNLCLVSRAEHVEITRQGLLTDNPDINKAAFTVAKLTVAARR